MTTNKQPPAVVPGTWLPLPAVLAIALLLAVAGVWCCLSAADESAQATGLLRERAAEHRSAYLRATRRATLARSRLLEAQQRLEAFVGQQYDELHQAGDGAAEPAPIEADQAAEPPTPEQLEAERLRGRLTELGHERSRLLERLTAEHPLVRDVDSQMADVRRLIASIPQTHALPPPAAASQTLVEQRRAQQRLGRQWQALVEESVAGSRQLEQQCRLVEQELVTIEGERAKSEKDYLASAEALAASAESPPKGAAVPTDWGTLLLASAGGLTLLVVVGWSVARMTAMRNCVIRQAGDLERLFHLPLTGLIAASDTGSMLTAEPTRRALPLVCQLLAALLVFVLVAITVQDPRWLGEIANHPVETMRQALGNLGGR